MFQKNINVSHPRAGWQACFDRKTPLAVRAKGWFALANEQAV
jgi:hypothetical protein